MSLRWQHIRSTAHKVGIKNTSGDSNTRPLHARLIYIPPVHRPCPVLLSTCARGVDARSFYRSYNAAVRFLLGVDTDNTGAARPKNALA